MVNLERFVVIYTILSKQTLILVLVIILISTKIYETQLKSK